MRLPARHMARRYVPAQPATLPTLSSDLESQPRSRFTLTARQSPISRREKPSPLLWRQVVSRPATRAVFRPCK